MLPPSPARPPTQWTFLTNHAHVLLCIVQSPGILMRDLVLQIGITERAVQRIVADLEKAGYLRTERMGRRNHYQVEIDQHLRHPIERHRTVASLVEMVLGELPLSAPKPAGPRKRAASSGKRAKSQGRE